MWEPLLNSLPLHLVNRRTSLQVLPNMVRLYDGGMYLLIY